MKQLKSYYDPVTVFNLSEKERAKGNINIFNDTRIESSVNNLWTKALKNKTLLISRLSESESDRKRNTRLLGNEKLNNEQLISYVTEKSIPVFESNQFKEVLVVSDLVNIKLTSCSKRVEQNGEELGVLNDNRTPGMLAHTSIVLDGKSKQLLGMSDLIIFNRKKRLVSERANKNRPGTRASATLPDEKKESEAWRQGAKNSHELLKSKGNQHRTYLFDSDADSIANFNYLLGLNDRENFPEQRDDFIIKMQYKRRVLNITAESSLPILDGRSKKVKSKKTIHLNEYGQSKAFQGKVELKLRGYDFTSEIEGKRRKRLARTAEVELKYYSIKYIDNQNREHEFSIIQAWEDPDNLPESERETAIDSMLITTKKVESLEQAIEVLQQYEQRWNIEQVFRTLKKQGLKIEKCQSGSINALIRLIIIGMEVSTQILKLVQARDQKEGCPITTVFTEKHFPILEKLNKKYEGNTLKQQNPYPKDQLSYGAWIIARMGGWMGYSKSRPPGPIIMGRGLEKFYIIVDFESG